MRLIAAILVSSMLFGCEDAKLASVAQDGSIQSLPPQEAQLSPQPGRPGSRPESGGGGVGGIGGGMQRATTDMAQAERAPIPPPGPSQLPPGQSTDTPLSPMIIKNGDANIEVDSLEIAITRVTQLAQRLGGVVANSSIQTGQKNFRTATMVLRIPSPQFDAAMSGLSPIGKVESQNVGSEDVTEQFVDMTARMKNAKRLEERLINLLATRTGKLEDVLAVERELARVREEIERYEGQLRYLRTRAAISTLTVNLHEPYPIVPAPPGTNVLAESLRRAWRNFVGVIAGTIAAIGALLPLIVLAVLLALVLRRFGLLPTFRRTPPPPPPPPAM